MLAAGAARRDFYVVWARLRRAQQTTVSHRIDVSVLQQAVFIWFCLPGPTGASAARFGQDEAIQRFEWLHWVGVSGIINAGASGLVSHSCVHEFYLLHYDYSFRDSFIYLFIEIRLNFKPWLFFVG